MTEKRDKIGDVEVGLEPITAKDVDEVAMASLAAAVLAQSASFLLGLREEEKEFSAEKERRWWKDVSETNLWVEIAQTYGVIGDNINDLKRRLFNADPKTLTYQFPIQRKRSRTKCSGE